MWIKAPISLGLMILSICDGRSKNTDWLDHLIRYVRDESEVYQIIFLIERKPEITHPTFDNVIQQVSKNFPTRKINLQDASVSTAEQVRSFPPDYDAQTTLFILMYDESELSRFAEPADFLTEISQNRRRSKCLIILPQRHPKSKYGELLRFMWSKQFLDVTIVEIVKSHDSKSTAFLENHDEDVTIFSYNPFLPTISSDKYSAETEWFPDKLKNLHGTALQVAWAHYPPFVFMPQSPLGQSDQSGLGVEKLNALAQHLNFKIKDLPLRDWGRFSCNIDELTGMFRGLLENEIQFFGVEYSIDQLCSLGHHEYGKGIGGTYCSLVVPLIQKENASSMMQWNIVNAIIIISIPLLVWITSRILRFNTRNWRIEYLSRIILGTAVPEEPQRLAERFVFGAMLVGCLSFSSEIYTVMTGNEISTEPSFEFQNVEEVLASDLEINIEFNVFTALYENSQGVLRDVLEKAKQGHMNEEECLRKVMKYRNTSCVMDGVIAERLSQKEKDEFDQPLVRILTHGQFPSSATYTPLGAGSPYVGRVDDFIQRLIDSGIASKWEEVYQPKNNINYQKGNSCSGKESESSLMIKRILFVLIFGYVISIFIFLCEVLAKYISRLHH